MFKLWRLTHLIPRLLIGGTHLPKALRYFLNPAASDLSYGQCILLFSFFFFVFVSRHADMCTKKGIRFYKHCHTANVGSQNSSSLTCRELGVNARCNVFATFLKVYILADIFLSSLLSMCYLNVLVRFKICMTEPWKQLQLTFIWKC